jgi:hypothetical protein
MRRSGVIRGGWKFFRYYSLGGFGVYATLRASRAKFQLGPVSFSALFTADYPASLVEVFSGASHFGGTTRLSHHLLLPQSVLPRIFSILRLRWVKAASALQGRNLVPSSAKHPSLLFVSGVCSWLFFGTTPTTRFFIGRLRSEEFGGLGSLIMLANVTLLTLYTFLALAAASGGGKPIAFPARPSPAAAHGLSWLSRLNERHMLFAWPV